MMFSVQNLAIVLYDCRPVKKGWRNLFNIYIRRYSFAKHIHFEYTRRAHKSGNKIERTFAERSEDKDYIL